MIAMNWDKMSREIASIAKAYEALPKHIAKKHLLAGMRRAVVKAGGVRTLRANTPPIGLKRGRKAKGARKTTGQLRRSVTTKGKWIGTNKAGWAVVGLGYKYGWNSRKAIWAEYGTKWQTGVAMMQRTFDSIRGPAAALMAEELRQAFEKACNEVAGEQNKGHGG